MLVASAALVLLVWVVWDGDAFASWMRNARPLPYFAAMCVLTAFGAPLTPFFLIAGATFGVATGLVGTALALAGSLALSYRLARGALRPRLVSLLRRFGRELPDYSEKGEGSLRFVLTVKLAPGVPAVLKNAFLAVSGVPFRLFFGSSFLVTGAYGVALILVGESLFDHDLGRALPIAVAVALPALALWWWFRRRARSGPRAVERG